MRKGDTLASIAKRYKVSVKNLAAENKLKTGESIRIGRTLIIPDEDDDPGRYRPAKTDKLVETGEKVPNGVLHTVQPGQSLWIIARAYNSKGATIARVNGFSTDEPLSVGRKILIPGAKEVVPVRVKGYVVQPIRFVRVWNDKKATVRLMTRSGKVSPYGRKVLSRLAASKTGRRRVKLLHPRLIHMIQRVAERWPGQTIEIISGYRPNQTGTESKHSQGRAIDFRVAGVSNRDLYEFCTQLPKSGCGYYPNSVFIHMDARDRSTTWTDYSGPGEGARYSKKKGGGSAGSDREEIADAEREGD